MSLAGNYYKYKTLTLDQKGELDNRTLEEVVRPIAESYFYLPTRRQLNDPNEGIFQNQIQAGINAFLQGVVGIGERTELAKAFYDLAGQISQSTDNSGVFSLSRNVTDELLWAHYSGSHCGISIEYNLLQLTRFCSKQHLHCFPVDYVEEPPSLDMDHLQDNAQQAIRAMLGHKSRRWRYEEEFRVLLENTNGCVPHDYRAVRSITFGLKVPDKVRELIFDATKHKVPKYYEIVQSQSSYRLERRPLEALVGESPTGEKSTVDWEECFNTLNAVEKARMIEIAQREIESDPHFEELYLAEKSTTNPAKAVLQYRANHSLGLMPWSEYTKYYYDL